MDPNFQLWEAFATELRTRRNAWRFSQEELAHRAGVNRTYIAKLELAKNQPSLTVLFELANALNCSLPDLLAGAITRYKRRPRKSAEERAKAFLQNDSSDSQTK